MKIDILEGTNIGQFIEHFSKKVEHDVNRVVCNITEHDMGELKYHRVYNSDDPIYGRVCKRCGIFEYVEEKKEKK